MPDSQDLLICTACGTQFEVPFKTPLKNCRICDDPRQFIPPSGQQWTSLATMLQSSTYHNSFTPLGDSGGEELMTSIYTKPKVGIGQRAILVQTPQGNVLWDCITYLDASTIEFIKSKGGLKAIVISHPHYYTTHLDWAETFDCPVYLAREDEEWLNRADSKEVRKFVEGGVETIVDGVTAIKTGGHFPGSFVLHCAVGQSKRLLIADTFVTTPSALYHIDRLPGTTSFAFMWAVPNMIPLPPAVLLKMWQAIRPYEFESTHGAFVGQEVKDQNVKARVLKSMKIQTRAMGWDDHAILDESGP